MLKLVVKGMERNFVLVMFFKDKVMRVNKVVVFDLEVEFVIVVIIVVVSVVVV